MALPSSDLCVYCLTRPALAGDLFCCEGCRTLASLQSDKKDVLVENFARPAGSLLHFECRVEPIACQACLQSLACMNEVFPNLQNLQWNREDSTLGFDFAKDSEDPELIFNFLKKMGLSPRWKTATDGSDEKKASRRHLLRLGVTAALAGNLMLFSIPIYGGLEDGLRTAFEWIQLVLFLPVLFWSARPFYRTAWLSFRLRHLSIDLPLVVAFLAGSFFSIFSLIRGEHALYFDSLAGFLFLILTSRFLLERSLARHLRAPDLDQFFENPVYELDRDGRHMTLLWRQLRPGDVLHLDRKARLPVDGVLQSSAAEFETSWMNGEKNPQLRLKGALLEAGMTLVSEHARVLVSKPAEETAFAALLGSLGAAKEKIRTNKEAKWGNVLVLSCFLGIAALILISPQLGGPELLRRGVSLLIIACPCAISFGVPLARARAGQIAFRWGFWVRDPQALDVLADAKKIAFDKTGTLTGNLLRIAPHSPILDARLKQIILSLENISVHPVAESLRKAWGPMPLLEVHQARENVGSGVQGAIDGDLYELKSAAASEDSIRVELFRNGKRLVALSLQDEPLPNAGPTLLKLSESHELYMISGDRSERVKNLARTLHIPSERALGDLKPEEKMKKIEEIRPDLYFGDGTNDLLALQNVPVSVSVPDAALEAKSASDILMLEPDLSRLPALFAVARETQKLVRRNLILALIYNACTGTAALMGWIHPLAAALLMPVASLTILLSTLWGTSGLRERMKPA